MPIVLDLTAEPPLDPFITATDVSDYLGRTVTGDPAAIIATEAACDICRTVAEQQFNRGTTTASYDGTGGDALLLGETPVWSAGTVVVTGGTVTDYMVTRNGLLLRGSAGSDPRPIWPMGRQNVVVTYDHGYDVVPQDVRMVAISVASRLVVQGLASEEQIGDVRIKYATAGATDLTNGERFILSKYRQIR
jgi:hypothetical protein